MLVAVVRQLPRDMDPPTISKSDTDQQPEPERSG
jgi:hypothetical protein